MSFFDFPKDHRMGFQQQAQPQPQPSAKNSVGKAGIGFGCALAMSISFNVNHSILWAVLHGVLSWLYVIYFAIWGG